MLLLLPLLLIPFAVEIYPSAITDMSTNNNNTISMCNIKIVGFDKFLLFL
jgi:hypothetical protein